MNKKLLFLFLFINCYMFAQKVRVDIFNNLEFSSSKDNYSATLEEDIFNDFEFTDSNHNCISFNKEYVIKYYPKIYQNQKIKIRFFKSIIREHKREHNEQLSYEIDIFDKEIIHDHKDNHKTVSYTDIFDNEVFESTIDDSNESIKKSLKGEIEYKCNSLEASLEIGFRNQWEYEDSTGNKFTFSTKAWRKLMKLHGDSEHIFFYLFHQFTE